MRTSKVTLMNPTVVTVYPGDLVKARSHDAMPTAVMYEILDDDGLPACATAFDDFEETFLVLAVTRLDKRWGNYLIVHVLSSKSQKVQYFMNHSIVKIFSLVNSNHTGVNLIHHDVYSNCNRYRIR